MNDEVIPKAQGDCIHIGESGTIFISQWGKIDVVAYGDVASKVAASEWRPRVSTALEYIRYKTGLRRWGQRHSSRRAAMVLAAVELAICIARRDGLESINLDHLRNA